MSKSISIICRAGSVAVIAALTAVAGCNSSLQKPGGSSSGLPGGGVSSPFPSIPQSGSKSGSPSGSKSGAESGTGSDPAGSGAKVPGDGSRAGSRGQGSRGQGSRGQGDQGQGDQGQGDQGQGDQREGSQGSAGAGGMGEVGEAGGIDGGSGDLDEAFEKSLGDFDGVIGRERAGMASTGQGSGGSARQREAGDAKSVSDASGRGGATGGMADIPGRADRSDREGGADPSGESAAGGGEGQADKQGEFEGGDVDESERDGARVAKIPDDIPADGRGDDQVARQIREAAMAERDPIIRDALWDEYRKHTGMEK
ncbi:MAG: hypothetical protein ACE5G3_07470 [Gammaproteobacteria bacterium]